MDNFTLLILLVVLLKYNQCTSCDPCPASPRYLLSDACVLLDKPLVSGSALRWEGQLTVYNWRGGPTYRCLYPQVTDTHHHLLPQQQHIIVYCVISLHRHVIVI